MNTFEKSRQFDSWLKALRDTKGKVRILHRIVAAENGNFGPGYRIYYTRKGDKVYLLLAGGDKSSQKRDIQKAIEMARTIGKE
ncbi:MULTISPECIES: type II toxin-antitoxin system RelE/ParE family toxin [unclassified Rhizobium]|uniref:type II toxin-antitoxin system RelE/ParE family toxin n=1 Tax=unclassified Rhizobium TaxID=2613769 RepID=UPI00288B0B14|nr:MULTISPECIES: type II toxin-antitoxin system RelE/ParE family toxin [unclassified Rhizobium]